MLARRDFVTRVAALVAICAAGGCSRPSLPATQHVRPELDVAIATYNLRYGSARDGRFHWRRRRRGLLATLRSLDCDLIGVQEAEIFQVHELMDALPEYGVLYRSRGLLRHIGESNAIFYRKSRLECDTRHSGTRWLSRTPKLPGSRQRGAWQPRIVTWGRFYDRATGKYLWLFNSHLEHHHEAVRKKQAHRLRRFIHASTKRFSDEAVVLTGDLNDEPASATLVTLRAAANDPLHLRDAVAETNPHRSQLPTCRGFLGHSSGPRIDYILVSPHCTVVAADIDERKFNASYPSDHVPLWARVIC